MGWPFVNQIWRDFLDLDHCSQKNCKKQIKGIQTFKFMMSNNGSWAYWSYKFNDTVIFNGLDNNLIMALASKAWFLT